MVCLHKSGAEPVKEYDNPARQTRYSDFPPVAENHVGFCRVQNQPRGQNVAVSESE
jgi:hypothetical protein